MTKNTTINIWNEHAWELDAPMLDFALRIAARHAPQASTIDIYPQERIPADAPAWKFPGRLEWIVRVLYRGGGALTIGLLQRTKDSEFESHT